MQYIRLQIGCRYVIPAFMCLCFYSFCFRLKQSDMAKIWNRTKLILEMCCVLDKKLSEAIRLVRKSLNCWLIQEKVFSGIRMQKSHESRPAGIETESRDVKHHKSKSELVTGFPRLRAAPLCMLRSWSGPAYSRNRADAPLIPMGVV